MPLVFGLFVAAFASCSGGKEDAKGGKPGAVAGKGKGGPGGKWGKGGPERNRHQIPVTCERVVRGPMEAYLQTVGSVVPYKEVEIKSEYMGRIYYTQRWEDGDIVEEGTVLAHIDDRSLRVDIAEAERQLAVAEENIQPVSADLAQARKDELYNGLMLEKGAVPRNTYERYVLTRIRAENTYNQTLATIETRRGSLNKMKQDLDKVVLKAPFDGMLLPLQSNTQTQGSQASNLTLNEGLIVGSNASICRIADIAQVVVELSVPGKDIAVVTQDQRVVLDIYSRVGREYSGTIYDISSTMDPTTRTFTVKVLVDNTARELRPGMFCKARIITETKPHTIALLRDLVTLKDNQHIVFVVEEVPDIASATKAEQVNTAIEEMDRDAIAARVSSATGESEPPESSEEDGKKKPPPPDEKPDPAQIDSATHGEIESASSEEEVEPDELPMKFVARERTVTLGIENKEQFEIAAGLQAGDLLVVVGYQTLTDGVEVNPKTRGEPMTPEEEQKDGEPKEKEGEDGSTTLTSKNHSDTSG